MKLDPLKLKELVVTPGHISEADFESARSEAEKEEKPLQEILLERELIKDENLGWLIAEVSGYQFINLKKEKIDKEVLQQIPELVARSRGVIAFSRTDQDIKVGMLNPDDLEIKHFIKKRTGQDVLPYLITKQGLQHALSLYKVGLGEEFKKIINQLQNPSFAREQRNTTTIEMVDMILMYGYQNGVSDIHIEPYREKIVVRFRIDGVLHDVLEIPKDLTDPIVTRVKILSKMRTDEHRSAQDGKFRFDAKEEIVDVRVSVVPVTEGESVVMRLLSVKNRKFNLKNLGLSERDLKNVKRAIKIPHGMVLSTGPTGCGKTTTLYAVMKIINTRDIHISTIEDPVEYDIEGVSQIQVNPATNLTFAEGLRAIVRQDPDIIMVGEIRDSETASIAINSAMTGHLVLSTLHANDAATTLPRLLDMGIEPFLIASTVQVIIAQRLVRRICTKCIVSYELSEEIKDTDQERTMRYIFDILKSRGHEMPDNITLVKGGGCKICAGTGYLGRIGIFEVLVMADNVKELIMERASSGEIVKAARENGMTTMLEDGIDKVLAGITTLHEVLRVTKE